MRHIHVCVRKNREVLLIPLEKLQLSSLIWANDSGSIHLEKQRSYHTNVLIVNNWRRSRLRPEASEYIKFVCFTANDDDIVTSGSGKKRNNRSTTWTNSTDQDTSAPPCLSAPSIRRSLSYTDNPTSWYDDVTHRHSTSTASLQRYCSCFGLQRFISVRLSSEESSVSTESLTWIWQRRDGT